MAYGAAPAKAYLFKIRDNLAANGVSMAFWDTGGMPYPSFTPEGICYAAGTVAAVRHTNYARGFTGLFGLDNRGSAELGLAAWQQ